MILYICSDTLHRDLKSRVKGIRNSLFLVYLFKEYKVFMFVAIVTTLMLLSLPAHSASPENPIAFPQEFANAFDKIVKQGLRQSIDFKSSAVYYAYEDIKYNGINEIGKRNKVIPLARRYQKQVLNDKALEATRGNALYPIDPKAEWALLLSNYCLKLQDILKDDISDIRLHTTGRPSTIIQQNSELKLSQDQKQAFLAAQLVIALNLYDFYRHQPNIFHVVCAQWCEDASKDKPGACIVS